MTTRTANASVRSLATSTVVTVSILAATAAAAQETDSALCTPLAGCVLEVADGCVRAVVPPLALDEPVTVTLTANGAFGTQATTQGAQAASGASAVGSVELAPGDLELNLPVLVEVCWTDADADGRVDLGACIDTPEQPCDADEDCATGVCSKASLADESDLALRLDGMFLGDDGEGSSMVSCGAHASAGENAELCATVVADCTSQDPADAAAVGCCQLDSNGWSVQTCALGSLMVGETEAELIPSEGFGLEDCHGEILVDGATTPAGEDDMPLPERVCHDGDVACDADASPDGTCTFRVGLCTNVGDDRLVDAAGHVKCAPTDVAVAIFEGQEEEVEAMAQALASVAGDVASVEAGAQGEAIVRFDPPALRSDLCPPPSQIRVAAGQTKRIRTSVAGATALELGIASEADPFRDVEDALESDSLCGDGDGSGTLTATDALLTLRSAVGIEDEGVVRAVVNVNADAEVSATDALLILQSAIGAAVEIACGVGPLPNDSDVVDLVCEMAETDS